MVYGFTFEQEILLLYLSEPAYTWSLASIVSGARKWCLNGRVPIAK